ncbi:MAG TPA: DUF481 domain-containing protein [Kofleriaceae bacterium]|nr:DUF481 domain-containing protein [Kofleriaceae bacterium]
MPRAVPLRLALAASLTFLALAAGVAPAAAQIVNVQGSLAAEPPAGWSGQLQAGVDWQTGNTSVVRLSGAGNLLYRRGPWLGLVLARGEYSEGQGVKLAEKSFEHLRGRRALGRRLLWEAYVQHEYDAFRRLSVRAVAGTGPALRVVDGARASVTVGVSYMLEYERLSTLEGAADSGARAFHHRASTYVTGSVHFGDGLVGTQTVYAQPRLADPADLLLLSETSLTSQLTKRLALTNAFVLSYDSTPPVSIHRLSTALRLSLALTF